MRASFQRLPGEWFQMVVKDYQEESMNTHILVE